MIYAVADDSDCDGPYLIPLKSIMKWGNPYRKPVWTMDTLKKRDVRQAIRDGRLEPVPSSMWNDENHKKCDYDDAERVAYLVKNKAQNPILIEVEFTGASFYGVLIQDGWHRLAAAIYRGDENILVEYGGGVRQFHQFFPDAVLA